MINACRSSVSLLLEGGVYNELWGHAVQVHAGFHEIYVQIHLLSQMVLVPRNNIFEAVL